MKQFTAGAIAGATSLVVAVPLLASAAFAQSSSLINDEARTRPIPSQACLAAMVDLDEVRLATFDDHVAEQKQHMQERIDDLSEIALITDDAERGEALRALHESMHEREEDRDIPDAVQSALDAVSSACGDTPMRGDGPRMGMRGGREGKMHGGMQPGFGQRGMRNQQ